MKPLGAMCHACKFCVTAYRHGLMALGSTGIDVAAAATKHAGERGHYVEVMGVDPKTGKLRWYSA